MKQDKITKQKFDKYFSVTERALKKVKIVRNSDGVRLILRINIIVGVI